jgi:hypothetical protein
MTTKELIKKVVGWFKKEPVIDLGKIHHLKQYGLKPVFYNQVKSKEVLR